MSGKHDDISFQIPTKSEPGISSPIDSRSTFKYEGPELADHYNFSSYAKLIVKMIISLVFWRTDILWRKSSLPHKTLQ